MNFILALRSNSFYFLVHHMFLFPSRITIDSIVKNKIWKKISNCFLKFPKRYYWDQKFKSLLTVCIIWVRRNFRWITAFLFLLIITVLKPMYYLQIRIIEFWFGYVYTWLYLQWIRSHRYEKLKLKKKKKFVISSEIQFSRTNISRCENLTG